MSPVSLVSDPEQDVKVFEKMLMETSNVDVLREEILGWVSKRAQLPEPGFEKLPPHVANQCRLIQGFMEKATLLGVEKQGLEEDMHSKVVQFNQGYEQMLNKSMNATQMIGLCLRRRRGPLIDGLMKRKWGPWNQSNKSS